jgi:DNA-binding NarL/FixJ family response regulator
MAGARVRVLIVDDHPLYRGGTQAALASRPGMEVVGAVGTAAEALRACRELAPDIVLLDINLPDRSGIEVAREMRSLMPDVGVIALSAYDDEAFILALAEVGVRGYLLKTATDGEIASAVQAVAAGGSVFAASVADALVRHSMRGDAAEENALTERESAVLTYVAEGLSNREIGRRLGISQRTAQAHLSRVFHKLGVGSRTEAVAVALKEGLVKVPEVGSATTAAGAGTAGGHASSEG